MNTRLGHGSRNCPHQAGVDASDLVHERLATAQLRLGLSATQAPAGHQRHSQDASIGRCGEIAQLVEHVAENRGVPSSSLGLAIRCLTASVSVNDTAVPAFAAM